jgi:hypothetical protein
VLRGGAADTVGVRREVVFRLKVLTLPLPDRVLLTLRVLRWLTTGAELRAVELVATVDRALLLGVDLVTTRGREAVRPLLLVDIVRCVLGAATRALVVERVPVGFVRLGVERVTTRCRGVVRVLVTVFVPDTRDVLKVEEPTRSPSLRVVLRATVLGGRTIRSRLRSISVFGSVRRTTEVLLDDALVRVRTPEEAPCCARRVDATCTPVPARRSVCTRVVVFAIRVVRGRVVRLRAATAVRARAPELRPAVAKRVRPCRPSRP